MANTTFDASNSQGYTPITTDSSLTDNPNDNLMYDLSLLSSEWWNTQTLSDGGDIRICDDSGTEFGSETAYSFELENFQNNGDGTGTGIIYFDSSYIDSTSNTTWRIYCGDDTLSLPAPSDTLGRNNVWNSNYLRVYHLGESSGDAIDSTGNSNTTYYGNLPTPISGKLGDGQDLDGSNDYTEESGSETLLEGLSAFTLQAWVNSDVIPASGEKNNIITTFAGGDNGQTSNNEGIETQFRDDQTFLIFHYYDSSGNSVDVQTNNTYSDNTNYLLHFNKSSSSFKIYVDGVEDGSISESESVYEGDTLKIGVRNGSGTYERFWDGLIDEVRILNASLSADWITTEYNNQDTPSTFWTTGSFVSTNTVSFSVDTLLKATQTKSFSVDTYSVYHFEKSFDNDTLLKATQEKIFDVDTLLKATQVKNFDVDTLLAKEQTKSFSVDTLLVKEEVKTFDVDTLLKATKEKTFDVDTFLIYNYIKSFSVDTYLIGYWKTEDKITSTTFSNESKNSAIFSNESKNTNTWDTEDSPKHPYK